MSAALQALATILTGRGISSPPGTAASRTAAGDGAR